MTHYILPLISVNSLLMRGNRYVSPKPTRSDKCVKKRGYLYLATMTQDSLG